MYERAPPNTWLPIAAASCCSGPARSASPRCSPRSTPTSPLTSPAWPRFVSTSPTPSASSGNWTPHRELCQALGAFEYAVFRRGGTAHRATGATYEPPPRTSALGSLVHYVTHADPRNYQPANISFDLLPPMEDLPRAVARDRQARRARQCGRALADFNAWFAGIAGQVTLKTSTCSAGL